MPSHGHQRLLPIVMGWGDICMCVKVHSPIYMNKEAGDQHLRFSSIILHLTYFWDRVSHWIWEIIGWATLASQWAPWSTRLLPTSAGASCKQSYTWLLCRFWGSKFRSSHLHSKHFTHSATSPLLLQSFRYFVVYILVCDLHFWTISDKNPIKAMDLRKREMHSAGFPFSHANTCYMVHHFVIGLCIPKTYPITFLRN